MEGQQEIQVPPGMQETLVIMAPEVQAELEGQQEILEILELLEILEITELADQAELEEQLEMLEAQGTQGTQELLG